MILPEYMSKELVAQYGIPIPQGRVALTALEAEARCREIEAQTYVVKAQIGAGGRGLAGGIRFAATPTAVRTEAANLLGTSLVTEQTAARGEIVGAVYIEAAVKAETNAYLALVLDPVSGQPRLLASLAGGVGFEEAAARDPSVVSSLTLPSTAIETFLAELGFPRPEEAADIAQKALKAFLGADMTLLEINPFALTDSGTWIALDSKVAVDPSALFRHPELESLVRSSERSAEEEIARQNEINLVKMSGDIGVVVNGAGLGLATNDMLIAAGGAPANFMDIRTTATSFQIARGVDLLLADPKIKAILVNVHGGGMTVCDTVAEGVAFAYARAERQPPLAVRFAGQNAAWAHRVISERRLPATVCESITDLVNTAVSLTKGRAA